MPGSTPHYSLTTLGPGEPLSGDSYKYTRADRTLIDTLLALGAEGHRHDGGAATDANPVVGPVLTLDDTVGTLPGGIRAYYKFSLVDPLGLETASSPESFVDTPVAIAAPAAPSLIVEPGGGTLMPGNHIYVLSAWAGANTQETAALHVAYILIPSGADNAVRLTYPTPPAGADGWNVYRQRPGETDYFFLVSVAVGPVDYTDTGAVAVDSDRRRPTLNTTNSTNTVNVALPAALPAPGWTWKVYRTTANNNWLNSLLHHVVEETFDGSGILVTDHDDSGGSRSEGQPPDQARQVGSPSKVSLTDSDEVDGTLPLARVAGFPVVITFPFPGTQSVVQGTDTWVCEFPQFHIASVRAVLGRGSAPASQPLIVDVNAGSGLLPTMTSIFTAPGDRPRILAGYQIGARVAPTADAELVLGDCLTVDVDQVGSAATPTEVDLVVSVFGFAYGWTSPLTAFP